jgi:D-alanyl-D-alanine carboxypeptidase/D-alanyl-D-alanine-endopeptidase (penicillin-binding protein 4)
MSSVRRLMWLLGALVVLAGPAAAAARAATGATLRAALDRQLAAAGRASGALAVDLGDGRVLYTRRARTGRIPASVEKLWTSAAALRRLGPGWTFATRLAGSGWLDPEGVWHGSLYLRGGGDPTLGDGALAGLADQVAQRGIVRVTGRVLGDGTLFDALPGVPSSGFAWSPDVEPLSALAYRRDVWGGRYVAHPARLAAARLARALAIAGVDVAGSAGEAVTPAGARPLASWSSPPLAALLRATNVPSDNFYAETLIKDLGAYAGAGGTTAAGAQVVRAAARVLGLRPRVVDGSGLSRRNRSSPAQVVALLRAMAADRSFAGSLAVAGRSGTLASRMRRTLARGRCTGKTGTLRDVSNLAGYCRTPAGRRVAFAIMMNRVWPAAARRRQDRMVAALAAYAP